MILRTLYKGNFYTIVISLCMECAGHLLEVGALQFLFNLFIIIIIFFFVLKLNFILMLSFLYCPCLRYVDANCCVSFKSTALPAIALVIDINVYCVDHIRSASILELAAVADHLEH